MEKISLARISDFLTRDELKAIMAGSGNGSNPIACYTVGLENCRCPIFGGTPPCSTH